ncbi:MAG: hypothetical protein M3N52_08245, partial [Actinomycetota bacterium]|nr:hypothetical protein [Actinomycetota bacterium]
MSSSRLQRQGVGSGLEGMRAVVAAVAVLLVVGSTGASAVPQGGLVVQTAPDPAVAGRFDADPATTERIEHRDPVAAAIAIAQLRFDDAADVSETARHAAHVVLSRDDT